MNQSQGYSGGNDAGTASGSDAALETLPQDFRKALHEFRYEWQQEIAKSTSSCMEEPQKQQLAEQLYQKAVDLEQRGKVYDAVSYYRKAVQLVPDIEFKYYERQTNVVASSESGSSTVATRRLHEDVANANADLCAQFEHDLCDSAYNGRLLLTSHSAGVLSTALHIGELPSELLVMILRWVVSSSLDMHSLEQCAAVCKGLYICARDEALWRSACKRVWRDDLSSLSCLGFPSWRAMYQQRVRMLFNGAYVCKTTYLREGENNYQDQFYRAIQVVEYYRYVRFYPDGRVIMLTSTDEPQDVLPKFKHTSSALRPDILCGRYKLNGDVAAIALRKTELQPLSRRPRHCRADDYSTISYNVELLIKSTPKRAFGQLKWLHYSIIRNRKGITSATEFDMDANKFPVFRFLPVRSYQMSAEAPLL